MMNSEQMHQHALRIAQEAIESIDYLDVSEDQGILEAMEGCSMGEVEEVWDDIYRIIINYTEVRIIPSRKIRND